jgi:hypothetical protein
MPAMADIGLHGFVLDPDGNNLEAVCMEAP